MCLSRVKYPFAVGTALTLAFLVGDPGTAAAQSGGGEPSRGYERQEWLRKRQQTTRVSPPAVRVQPLYPPATVVYPAAPAGPTVTRTGPVLAAPVTTQSAPAVTGDATAARPAEPAPAPQPAAVVVWYEYVPALGGWVEFRGTRVAGPPAGCR